MRTLFCVFSLSTTELRGLPSRSSKSNSHVHLICFFDFKLHTFTTWFTIYLFGFVASAGAEATASILRVLTFEEKAPMYANQTDSE